MEPHEAERLPPWTIGEVLIDMDWWVVTSDRVKVVGPFSDTTFGRDAALMALQSHLDCRVDRLPNQEVGAVGKREERKRGTGSGWGG